VAGGKILPSGPFEARNSDEPSNRRVPTQRGARRVIEQGRLVVGRGFIGVDGATKYDDKDLAAYLNGTSHRTSTNPNLILTYPRG
jgi:hypothetical protein